MEEAETGSEETRATTKKSKRGSSSKAAFVVILAMTASLWRDKSESSLGPSLAFSRERRETARQGESGGKRQGKERE